MIFYKELLAATVILLSLTLGVICYNYFFIDATTKCRTTKWLEQFIKFLHPLYLKKYGEPTTFAVRIVNFNQLTNLYQFPNEPELIKQCHLKLKDILDRQKKPCFSTITTNDTFIITCYGLVEFESTNLMSILINELNDSIGFKDKSHTTFLIGAIVKHTEHNIFGNRKLHLSAVNVTLEKALKQALQTRNSTYFIYNQTLHSQDDLSIERLKELQDALDANEFIPYYQPIYRTSDHTLSGLEALVRWNHPQKGVISPFFFLEDFDYFKLSPQLDFKILEQAIIDTSLIHKQLNQKITVSVNFTFQTIMKQGFVDKVLEFVDKYNFPTECLILELTEHTLINNFEIINTKIARLAERGIRLSLDDFGSGYANFTTLSNVNFDNLKLDRSIVVGICEENKISNLIYLMVLNLIQSENKTLTCEGIETVDMIRKLETIIAKNIDFNEITDKITLQGYYFSKPLPLKYLIRKIQNDIGKGEEL